ncbi:C4-dicarboxylate TRAP transporter substrate-binding protein [Pseudooceanicola sp.]|uniref:C4-dicarboxylate TRAP transporter substrate-binding protein n=1 Tax=Pseudooceanicola sp. TaxID=1914328 RepID=UPI00262C4722|nr:C4-dicarboxylate TRAP transporter substrate-binding protein [Pseudooceanicola sp.]MDF1854465.1 C4-dicarboxylate TRAP transporter substrate-binding protein [Pseudooceanicola sp.]
MPVSQCHRFARQGANRRHAVGCHTDRERSVAPVKWEKEMKSTTFACAAAAAFAFGLTAMPASARDMTYGSYTSPTSTTMRTGIAPLLKRLEDQSNGEMKWETFTGGAMGGAKELLGNAGSGILDASLVVDIYVKASLPHASLISGMMVVGENPLAMAGAMNEFQLLHCPGCLKDHEKNNVKAMGFTATGTYHLICKDEIHTAEQLRGKKVRAVASVGRAIQALGGTPVSITLPEMYEAMQRGQIDCATGSAAWLDTYNLQDFSKSIVTDSLGSYFGSMNFVINKDVWDDLSEANQKIIKANMARVSADVVFAYAPEGAEAIKNFEAKGGKAYTFDDEMQARLAKARADEYAYTIAFGKKNGIENAEELVTTFEKLVDKWTGIVKEIGNDKEAYIQRLQTEVYDKI